MAIQSVQELRDDNSKIVPKDLFFNGMVLPVNVYLKLKSNHYILIGKKGEKSDFSQLHSFNSTSSEVCVEQKDHEILMAYLMGLTGKIIDQENVPGLLKVKFLNILTENALNSFQEKNFSSPAQMQQISKFIISLNEAMPEFDKVLELVSTLPKDEAKHSMATCLIALAICQEMQVTLISAKEKVALASLLHDVGLKSLPPELIFKPRHLRTYEENVLFETHPLKGVELLRDIKEISNDVLLIIAEHHEMGDGTGFPKRIRDVKISPLGRIVCLANHFSSLLFSRSEFGKEYTCDEAIEYIEDILGQPFNKQVFGALKNIINKSYLGKKAQKA